MFSFISSSSPPVEFFQCLYHTYTPDSLVFTLFPFHCDLIYFLFSWTQTFLLVYFYCRFYEKGMWLFHVYYLNVSLLNFSRFMLFTFLLVKDQLWNSRSFVLPCYQKYTSCDVLCKVVCYYATIPGIMWAWAT